MGERPTWPTHAEVAQSLIEQHSESRFSALVGTIQSYDPVTQRADVVIGVRNPYQDPEGSGHLLREDFPVIPNVKVLFPRMGKWFIAMSVQPGDRVQLLFNTLSHEDWMIGDGRVAEVSDTRRQHLSHAVALIGMNINSEALAHAPPTPTNDAHPNGAMVLGHDGNGPRVALYRDGRAEITRGDAVVQKIDADGTNHIGGPEGQAIATAQAVTSVLESLKTAIAGWTPTPGDGGASLKAVISAWSAEVTGATKAKAT